MESSSKPNNLIDMSLDDIIKIKRKRQKRRQNRRRFNNRRKPRAKFPNGNVLGGKIRKFGIRKAAATTSTSTKRPKLYTRSFIQRLQDRIAMENDHFMYSDALRVQQNYRLNLNDALQAPHLFNQAMQQAQATSRYDFFSENDEIMDLRNQNYEEPGFFYDDARAIVGRNRWENLPPVNSKTLTVSFTNNLASGNQLPRNPLRVIPSSLIKDRVADNPKSKPKGVHGLKPSVNYTNKSLNDRFTQNQQSRQGFL